MVTIPYSTSGRNWTAASYNALIAAYDAKIQMALDDKTPLIKSALAGLISARRFWFLGSEPVMGGGRTAPTYAPLYSGVAHDQGASDSAAASIAVGDWNEDARWGLVNSSAPSLALVEHSLKIHRRTSPEGNSVRLAFEEAGWQGAPGAVVYQQRPPQFRDMRFLRWGVAELVCEGLTELTIPEEWDRFGCYRIHNLSWADLTVTHPGGTLVVPKFGCRTLRRHEDGTWESGLAYFWRCKPDADPKVWWSNGDETACNVGNIQQFDLWLTACQWTPDPSVSIPDAASRYCSAAPTALYPIIGPSTNISQLRYHGGPQAEPVEVGSPTQFTRWMDEGLPLILQPTGASYPSNMSLAEATNETGDAIWTYAYPPGRVYSTPVTTAPPQRTAGTWMLGPIGWCRRDTWTIPLTRLFNDFLPYSLYSTVDGSAITLPELRLASSTAWPPKFPPGHVRMGSTPTEVTRKRQDSPFGVTYNFRQSPGDWSFDAEGNAATPVEMPLQPSVFTRGIALDAQYVSRVFLGHENWTASSVETVEGPHYFAELRRDKATSYDLDLRSYRVPLSRELWDWYAWRVNSWKRSLPLITITDLAIGGLPDGYFQIPQAGGGPWNAWGQWPATAIPRWEAILGTARRPVRWNPKESGLPVSGSVSVASVALRLEWFFGSFVMDCEAYADVTHLNVAVSVSGSVTYEDNQERAFPLSELYLHENDVLDLAATLGFRAHKRVQGVLRQSVAPELVDDPSAPGGSGSPNRFRGRGTIAPEDSVPPGFEFEYFEPTFIEGAVTGSTTIRTPEKTYTHEIDTPTVGDFTATLSSSPAAPIVQVSPAAFGDGVQIVGGDVVYNVPENDPVRLIVFDTGGTLKLTKDDWTIGGFLGDTLGSLRWEQPTTDRGRTRFGVVVRAGGGRMGGLSDNLSVILSPARANYTVDDEPQSLPPGSPSVQAIGPGAHVIDAPGTGAWRALVHGAVYVNLG